MTAAMARTSQPRFLAAWIRAFTSFDQAHEFAVNLSRGNRSRRC